jgi:hypothetical protein
VCSPQAALTLLPTPTPPILPLPWSTPARFRAPVSAPVRQHGCWTPPRIARAQTAGRAGAQRNGALKNSRVPHRDVPAALQSVASARRRASEVHCIFSQPTGTRTASVNFRTDLRRVCDSDRICLQRRSDLLQENLIRNVAKKQVPKSFRYKLRPFTKESEKIVLRNIRIPERRAKIKGVRRDFTWSRYRIIEHTPFYTQEGTGAAKIYYPRTEFWQTPCKQLCARSCSNKHTTHTPEKII